MVRLLLLRNVLWVPVACLASAGFEARAQSAVSAPGPEVLEARSRYQRVYHAGPNQVQLHQAERPLCYQAEGEWQAVDFRVQPTEQGLLHSSGSDYVFGELPDGGFRMGYPDSNALCELFAHPHLNQAPLLPTAAWLPGSEEGQWFRAYGAGIRREVLVADGLLKTNYHLQTPQPEWLQQGFWITETIRTQPGWAVTNAPDGLLITDATGRVHFQVYNPVFGDQRTLRHEAPALPGTFAVQQVSDTHWEITYGMPAAWLADPAREYPVVLDPVTGVFTVGFPNTSMATNGTYTMTITNGVPACGQLLALSTGNTRYQASFFALMSHVTTWSFSSCAVANPSATCNFALAGTCFSGNQALNVSCYPGIQCTDRPVPVIATWTNPFGFNFVTGIYELRATLWSPNYDGGTVGSAQTIPSGTAPADLTGTSADVIDGVTCENITYQWQVSTGACNCGTNVGWTDIPGATGATLTSAQMGPLTTNTCYRRRFNSECNFVIDILQPQPTRVSNCVQITVAPLSADETRLVAQAEPARVQLSWVVSASTEPAAYHIQRSTPQNPGWQALGVVEQGEQVEQQHRLSFTDATVRTGQRYYYRLASKHPDGSWRYSNVAEALLRAAAHPAVQLLPNPTTGWMQLQGTELPTQMQVYNTVGACIATLPVSADARLNLTELPAGLYVLQYTLGGEVYRHTVLKNQ